MRTNPTAALLTALTCGLLALLPGGCARAADARPTESGLVHASATHSIRTAPDRFGLTVGVVSSAATAAAALAENSERSRAVTDAVLALGIAERRVQTSGFSISPRYSSRPRNAEPDWRPEIVGFQVSNRISFETGRLDDAGALITAVTRAGANDVGDLRFFVADPQPLRLQAIEAATRAARAEIDAAARAAGATPGAIHDLRIDAPRQDTPMPMMRAVAMDAAMESAPISAGEVGISATVSMSVRLTRP